MKTCLITWSDAVSVDEWTDVDEAKELVPHEILTIGFVVAETDECIVMAASWDIERGAVCSYISIPSAWIIDRQEIEIPGGFQVDL